MRELIDTSRSQAPTKPNNVAIHQSPRASHADWVSQRSGGTPRRVLCGGAFRFLSNDLFHGPP
jgi:hypothetical protein